MFTDMVGYTSLTQSNESRAMEVLDRHNRLLRPFFPKFNGREVKAIGDSFLVEFNSALDALRCAVEIQSYLHDYNFSSKEEWRINLRIGIHLGDVIHQDGDVLGDAVNIASRIEPLAAPEGVVISDQVYDQVQNKSDLPLVSLGEKSLKNVSRPIQVFAVQMPWEAHEQQTEARIRHDAHRVAVLPLANMISDPAEEYFADGMTEELISAVSKVPQLSVISRTSVMGYKNQAKQAAEISRELNVGTLLEGSVRKAGNRVRVSVQLIDANNDRHLWAENYDRNLEDVFAIQSEIAENVADKLKIRLFEGDVQKLRRAPTNDPVAHDFYMKGRSHHYEGSERELKTAIGYYEQAIHRDPRYVDPYLRMAVAYSSLGFHEMMPSRDAITKIEELTRKTLQLDESSAGAHLMLAVIRLGQMDFSGYMKEVQLALELDPNDVNARGLLAVHLVNLRQFERAHLELRKMLELDPLSVETMNHVATQYLYSGETDKAIELYEKILVIEPNHSFALGNLGLCHIRKGMYDTGLAEVEKSIEMEGGGSPNSLADLPYALTKAGELEKAKEVVAQLVRRYEEHGIGAGSVARGYAAIGEKDKTLEWLEKAYNERAPMLRTFSVDFNFEGMQSDPRFKAFLKKLGLDFG